MLNGEIYVYLTYVAEELTVSIFRQKAKYEISLNLTVHINIHHNDITVSSRFYFIRVAAQNLTHHSLPVLSPLIYLYSYLQSRSTVEQVASSVGRVTGAPSRV